jgi:3-oxoacyl-[acyl-carrier protein] reductase
VAELRRDGLPVHGVPADVTDPDSLAHLMEVVSQRTGGHLDVLVANVGVMFDQDLADVSLTDWNRCLELNLTSVMLTFQAALPLVERTDTASMIAMSSGAGSNRQTHAGIAYASAKAGVAQFVRVMGTRLGPSGIRVNAVAPGIADTPMTHDLVGDQVSAVEANIPLRRLGDPTEIATAVLFLASPMSSYITGQIIHVSGGV